MTVEKLNLKPPSILRRVFEKAGVGIAPWHLCKDGGTLETLYKKFPGLAGDGTAIGPGDDGNCQSWRNNPGWWIELIKKHG